MGQDAEPIGHPGGGSAARDETGHEQRQYGQRFHGASLSIVGSCRGFRLNCPFTIIVHDIGRDHIYQLFAKGL
jgi:hypothetical protein